MRVIWHLKRDWVSKLLGREGNGSVTESVNSMYDNILYWWTQLRTYKRWIKGCELNLFGHAFQLPVRDITKTESFHNFKSLARFLLHFNWYFKMFFFRILSVCSSQFILCYFFNCGVIEFVISSKFLYSFNGSKIVARSATCETLFCLFQAPLISYFYCPLFTAVK